MADVSVMPPSRGAPGPVSRWILQQDRWDDFGFKTQYQLFQIVDGSVDLIGSVKILKRGQIENVSSLLPAGRLETLGDDYCSLGQSLDYYERIAELPSDARDEILTFLRDALREPEHAATFHDEEGWRVSVTRDLDLDSYAPLASTLLDRNYSSLPSLGLQLSFQAAGWRDPLLLVFDAPPQPTPSIFGPTGGRGKVRLPDRIAVVTGRNGSGKSTLLARLARVLHASQHDRGLAETARLGSIEPAGIGFTRIVTIAYSAFDTFQVPGTSDDERRQIIKDVRAGTGRYVFAGLRDIARELEERVTSHQTAPDDALDERVAMDRQGATHLKSAAQLAEEYVRTLDTIFSDGRQALLLRVLKTLLADPSFSDIPDQNPAVLLAGDARTTFMAWSTGHKIVMHAAATLVAHTQPKSIVLLDEPESHLHPPLLAALMHALRTILDDRDAFAVIATHSPVVAQETLGRHVSVVNRAGDEVRILPSRIETYGESIGEITDEIFGLHPGATDYHATLRAMIDDGMNLERIEALFDRGLSLQARAYVMSLTAATPA